MNGPICTDTQDSSRDRWRCGGLGGVLCIQTCPDGTKGLFRPKASPPDGDAAEVATMLD